MILTALYLLCAALLTLYAVGELLLLLVYLLQRRAVPLFPPPALWPQVVVQLPIYNERYVVERLLNAAAALDYPAEQLSIQVLDDSTDETAALVAALVQHWQAQGVAMQHLRRAERTGFKAGALAYGLAQTDATYAVIFDADFVPPPDFLRRTIPYLEHNPQLGVLQTRWGHLNPFQNLLTWGQTLMIDGHFVVEQQARAAAGWLLNFNGSGGVWRTACIRAVGGWLDRTLTEDLDLSYRAQLAGWVCAYAPEIVVPGELPAQMAAYQQQQARWAWGSTQCLRLLLPAVWRARRGLLVKLMATLHLCQYLPHVLMLLLVLLTPLLLLFGGLEALPLRFLGWLSLAPPLLYAVSQRALYADWPRRLLAFPMLVALGTGLAWSNSRAVFGGLFGHPRDFRRTPKQGYSIRSRRGGWAELALAAYAGWGCWLAVQQQPPFVLVLLVYALAFACIGLWRVLEQ